MIDLSIVIVSYRGWERLQKCLEALNTFTGKEFITETIIVDNCSGADHTGRIKELFPGFRLVQNSVNGGFANGCNIGSRSAAGEYLLFLNPDTVPSEEEVGKLLITAKGNNEYTVLSCRQVNNKGKDCIVSGPFLEFSTSTGLLRAISGKKSNYSGKGKEVGSRIMFPDWVSGSVIMIRRNIFIDIGGFDEDFWMYYEDMDLCRRIRNKNGNIALCTDIVIEHNHGGSSREDINITACTKSEVYKSKHIYVNRHCTGAKRILIQVFLVINNIVSAVVPAIFGLLLFFVPKIYIRTLIFLRLIEYYYTSAVRHIWLSKRSVNFHKKLTI